MAQPERLLLVCPPWRPPVLPSLGIATLRPIVDAAGIACDELHCATLFPLYPSLGEQTFLEWAAAFLFGALIHPELGGERLAARIPDADERARGLAAARTCLDRCVDQILARDHDIIAMSVTFETQMPAALALAHRVKARRPRTRIIAGGAACAGEQADGVLASFPVLDVVCGSEGEAVIVPLVRALRGELPLAEVPGIAYRLDDGAPARTASPPLLMDLDTLPVPDFSGFIEQYEKSEWRSLSAPHLTFETSRGCWYGEKNLCTFCGLNGEGLAYRRKSPARAFDEIERLYRSYPSSGYMEATDNILDLGYLKEVMPRLAELPMEPERPLRLFFEIKSNLRREQVHMLARGHVSAVQPGIESFSDGVLELMTKGCTGANQVQFLKWIDEAGIKPTYNILVRNPGEQAAWYREMEALLPFISHLTPPTGLSAMHLERFSPYHMHPESYGISNVRPRAYYADLYPGHVVDERATYMFDYDHAMLDDDELRQARHSFSRQVEAWQEHWRPHTLFYLDRGEALEVHDRRHLLTRTVELRGAAAELFRYLGSARKPASLRQHFSALQPAFVECLLAVWRRRRWLCELSGRILIVVPEHMSDRGAARPGFQACEDRSQAL